MSTSCPKCGLKFSDPSLSPESCPNCGEMMANGGGSGRGPGGPIRGYFERVWKILTHPSAFFRTMPVRGGVSGPLAFALITHWMGAAVAYIWRIFIGGAVSGYLDRIMRMAGDVAEVDNPGRNAQIMEMADRMKHWVWGTGSIIVDPFLTLMQIFFISFLVFLGARIFVTPGKNRAPREITFESALRIVCFGMTPAILAVLPLFGGPIAYIYQVVVSVIGAREVYKIDNGRASLVALFPQVLLFGFVMLLFLAAAVAIIKFFAMSF